MQPPARLIAREGIVDALERGRKRLRLRRDPTLARREPLIGDASGDRLDAVLCLRRAGWASARPGYGLPQAVDALEGWIVSA